MADKSKKLSNTSTVLDNDAFPHQMFRSQPAHMLLIDPVSSALINANQLACDFYGYPLKTLETMRMHASNILNAVNFKTQMKFSTREDKYFFACSHQIKEN